MQTSISDILSTNFSIMQAVMKTLTGAMQHVLLICVQTYKHM